MTLNMPGALAVLAGIVAFAVTWRLVKSWPTGRKLLALALSTLLSLPTLLFAVYYLHVLPDEAWFYELRSWSGSEFLAIFVGCAGGCVASFLPNLLMGFPLFGVIVLASIPCLKPLFSPLASDVFRDQWKDGVCLQSTLSTCGPASVCTILASQGEKVSELEMAREAYSYTGGTEAWYLARAARARGFRSQFYFGETFAPDIPLPAMVGVRHGRTGHFIAVLSIKDGIVTFADPLEGKKQIPLQVFLRRFTFSGFHLSITKN
jgi:hypothetical protein